jgi:hypothetical protein
MRSALFISALALGTLGLVPARSPGQASSGPRFSHPLEITNAFCPFPDQALHVQKGMIGSEGTLEIAEFVPRTRTFSFAGQEVVCRTLFEWEFFLGDLMEVSANYFAQADDGSVYYFGEVVVATEPGGDELSWLVGGATLPSDPPSTLAAEAPALFMPGQPDIGSTWKPEDMAPAFEEQATVIGVEETVRTAFGDCGGCLKVLFSSGGDDQHVKFLAPGIGEVLEVYPDEFSVLAGAIVVP